MVVHLGIHGWPLVFSKEGVPPTVLDWLTFFCNDRADLYRHSRLLMLKEKLIKHDPPSTGRKNGSAKLKVDLDKVQEFILEKRRRQIEKANEPVSVLKSSKKSIASAGKRVSFSDVIIFSFISKLSLNLLFTI